MLPTLIHTLVFTQGPISSQRSIVLKLTDKNFWPAYSHEGTWKQGKSDPEGINLYPNFTMEDKARLLWRWDDSQHGGLLQLGINTPSETIQGRTSKSYFTAWFSFRGCQRYVHRQFRIAGGQYPGGEGVAWYELAGSSNTFQHGSGEWSIIQYDERS